MTVMLIILYLDSGFIPGKLLLLKRNLSYERTECFVGTLACNFSTLFSFLSPTGAFSDWDLWTPSLESTA